MTRPSLLSVRISGYRWCVAVCGGMLLIIAPVALAQPIDRTQDVVDTPGLVMEATAGWDGTIDTDAPVPISFLINNYSDEAIEGEFYLSEPSNGREVRLGEMFVGAGATRRFASIQSLHRWNECFATLRRGDEVIWRRELILRTGQGFFPSVNFVLFIDDGGRKLSLPGGLSEATSALTETSIAAEAGRPICSLTVKTWQVPDHFAPLTVAEVVVFAEDADPDQLNRAQWQAIAKWMCQGGSVFAHQDSKELIQRLLDSSPLNGSNSEESDGLVVRKVGLGAVYESPDRLFSTEGTDIRRAFANITARLPKQHLYGMVNAMDLYRRRAGRADWNKIKVAVFFVCYTVFSGVVALLLFRLSRRQMGIYIAAVVAIACVLAGSLGVMLRYSRGDLRWASVTQMGAGGMVQVGKIDVQSAGARNTQVAITGEHADMQATGIGRRWYNWDRQKESHPAFTWQPNRAKSDDTLFQVNVPMTPWGERQLHASAFKADRSRLEFQLQFQPGTMPSGEQDQERQRSRRDDESPKMPSGKFTVKLTNHLPFDVLDCWLVIGVTARSSGSAAALERYSGWRQTPPDWVTAGSLMDVYHVEHIRNLNRYAAIVDSFDAEFQLMQNNHWDRSWAWQQGSIPSPKISRLGTATAWIVGRIERSPIIDIDESACDFVRQEELHLFIQEIRSEDMADAGLFLEDASISATPTDVINSNQTGKNTPQ